MRALGSRSRAGRLACWGSGQAHASGPLLPDPLLPAGRHQATSAAHHCAEPPHTLTPTRPRTHPPQHPCTHYSHLDLLLPDRVRERLEPRQQQRARAACSPPRRAAPPSRSPPGPGCARSPQPASPAESACSRLPRARARRRSRRRSAGGRPSTRAPATRGGHPAACHRRRASAGGERRYLCAGRRGEPLGAGGQGASVHSVRAL